MGRYDFQSPGAFATNAIQDFTKQRNADERQALLDALQKQDLEKKWGIQQGELDLARNADTRAGVMQKENILKGRVPLLPHTATDASGFDPEMQNYLGGLGLIKANAGTGGQVVENPDGTQQGSESGATFSSTATAPSSQFIGSQDFQKDEERKSDLEKVLASRTLDPTQTKALELVKAGAIQQMPANMIGGPPSVTPISWQGKKLSPVELPYNGQGMELNPPPSAYFPGGGGNKPQFVGMSPDGKPIIMRPDGKFEVSTLTGAETIDPKPSAYHLPTAMLNSIAAEEQAIAELEAKQPKTTWTGAPVEESPELKGHRAKHAALMSQYAGQLGANPEVLDMALQVMQNPTTSNMPFVELIKNLDPNEWKNPNDLKQLEQLLNQFRGGVPAAGGLRVGSGAPAAPPAPMMDYATRKPVGPSQNLDTK